MNKVCKGFYLGCWLCGTITSYVFTLVGITLIGSEGGMVLPGVLFLLLGSAVGIFSSIVGLVLLYKMWASIQGMGARTTPGKAVGFLFIPFFNLYWIFQIYWGWTKDYNKITGQRGIESIRMPEGLAVAISILAVCSIIPFAGTLTNLVNFILLTILFSKACDGINLLADIPLETEATKVTAHLVKPNTSGLAIASLALGICGFCTAGITAIAGLILGIIGLNAIKKNAGRLKGRGLAVAGIVVSAIVSLTIAAGTVLYMSGWEVLRPKIDMTGGTSLIYEIDTEGLTAEEKTDLSERMIVVLRKRVDPRGYLNLIWRPLGDTRLEIQMPPAGAKSREARLKYEDALEQLLEEAFDSEAILRTLPRPQHRDEESVITAGESDSRLLKQFGMTERQLVILLENPKKREVTIERLIADFPGRRQKIEILVAAFDKYMAHKKRLDEPQDLRRMLKGAGVLEFRVLPTADDGVITASQIEGYIETLNRVGPRQASDGKYVWAEVEKPEEWNVHGTVTGVFGEKLYVLAGNQTNEAILQGQAKLKRAYPASDGMGRRAIGFTFDDIAARLFYNVTKENIDRPLCILLDGMAISAPNIQSAIRSKGIITGSFSTMECDDIINKLNAGSLPAKLIEPPISVKTIAPLSSFEE